MKATNKKLSTLLSKNKNLQSRNIGAKRDKIADKFYKELAVIHSERGAVARFRFYCTGQTIHCIAWVGSRDLYGSGYGRAGGYGYDKASAAMADAIDHAGIKMSQSIAGVGDTAMKDAAVAIGKMLTGCRKFYIHESHA